METYGNPCICTHIFCLCFHENWWALCLPHLKQTPPTYVLDFPPLPFSRPSLLTPYHPTGMSSEHLTSAFLSLTLLEMVVCTPFLYFQIFIDLSLLKILLSPPHEWNCLSRSPHVMSYFSSTFCHVILLLLHGELSSIGFTDSVLLVSSFSLVMPEFPLLVSPNHHNLLNRNAAWLGFYTSVLPEFTSYFHSFK